MTTSGGPSPRISFSEDDQRTYVQAYVQKPKFHVGDKVYLLNCGEARKGPYVIAAVPSVTKYVLNFENGEAVRNGEEIDIDYLEAAEATRAS
ncbi:hypothetical protein FALCPG4_015193 [Fusarium falciforme]